MGEGNVRLDTATRVGANALVVAAWLALHARTVVWLATVPLSRADHRVGLEVIAVLALFAIARHLWDRRAAVDLHDVHNVEAGPWWRLLARAPRGHPAAWILTATSALAHLALERWLPVHAFLVFWFALGTCGLVGLYRRPSHWHRSLSGWLVAGLGFAFGGYVQAYGGLLVRSFTASVVQRMLTAQGVRAISSQSILVLENGIAHVDAPCSGLRGLWIGALFFAAATWLDRRRFGPRWLGCAAAFGALLLACNILRVHAIVSIAIALNQPKWAELVHEPLGAVGFVFSCAVGMWALRTFCPREASSEGERSTTSSIANPPGWLPQAVLASALSVAAVTQMALPRHRPQAVPSLSLPSSMNLTPTPLTVEERRLFANFGAQAVKYRFEGGSVVLVASTALQAHHVPELCLASEGHRLTRSTKVDDPFAARVLGVEDEHQRRTDVYWFQSRHTTTAEFLDRAVQALFYGDRHWVMASVLWDGDVAPTDPAIRARLVALHRAIADHFEPTDASARATVAGAPTRDLNP